MHKTNIAPAFLVYMMSEYKDIRTTVYRLRSACWGGKGRTVERRDV
jgi:hypothetical protein